MLDTPGQYQSYLLRLYRPGPQALWRVILEAIPAGERQGFADLQAAFEFLRSQAPSLAAPDEATGPKPTVTVDQPI